MSVDLSKTFDTKRHSLALNKLLAYGVNSKGLNWLQPYFFDLQQIVQYDITKSEPHPSYCRVLQRSQEYPCYFYFNDRYHGVKESVFGVILVRIFPGFSRVRTEYLSVFSPNVRKSGKNADKNNSEYSVSLRIQSECCKIREKCRPE